MKLSPALQELLLISVTFILIAFVAYVFVGLTKQKQAEFECTSPECLNAYIVHQNLTYYKTSVVVTKTESYYFSGFYTIDSNNPEFIGLPIWTLNSTRDVPFVFTPVQDPDPFEFFMWLRNP
ncbi:MAG: hypothetical protein J4432_04120 [DPANN group archaeon]|nr:hypothetical protein [DPANN group archaeon]